MSLHQVSLAVSESFRRLIPSLSGAEAAILSRCRPIESRAAHPNTHWQCNGALLLTSTRFAKYQQPSASEFADRVVRDLNLNPPSMVERAFVSGPGFITLTAEKSWILQQISTNDVLSNVQLPEADRQKILIDMSSPNIAKRMHVGHIRSTVIGEALANLLQAQGHQVEKINHIGDCGSQFGVILAAIDSKGLDPDNLDIDDLDELYRSGKQISDEAFLEKCREYVLRLQNGDPEILELWQKIKEISRREYNAIYRILGIKSLLERGESFYLPLLDSTVSELIDRNIAKHSQGAICVFEEKDDFPLMIRKSDGGYTYDTTDLAALRYRLQVDKADRIIYVVDHGQAEHFRKLFSAGKKAGWISHESQCQFVGFGVVLGPDGKRFRTRLGNAMPLSSLLDTAVQKAKEVLLERNYQDDEASFERTAEAIGISAIKYADLSRQRDSNITFNMNAMLDFKGNTSVYLQYALCRALKILNESDSTKLDSSILSDPDLICNDFERDLCVVILRYKDAIDEAVFRLEPHIFCQYLYSLTSAMNAFYNNCPILGHERQAVRLTILQRAVQVLTAGFNILGIAVVHRM